jgi:hypothetical protein
MSRRSAADDLGYQLGRAADSRGEFGIRPLVATGRPQFPDQRVALGAVLFGYP